MPDFFTFTFVAEPLTTLVNGILETESRHRGTKTLTGERLVAILREMVLREREPTGSWTSSAHQYDVHWASQVALLMNMFDAPGVKGFTPQIRDGPALCPVRDMPVAFGVVTPFHPTTGLHFHHVTRTVVVVRALVPNSAPAREQATLPGRRCTQP